ncbi:unnamed protein product, partial [Meganyctiphanes norvegica]
MVQYCIRSRMLWPMLGLLAMHDSHSNAIVSDCLYLYHLKSQNYEFWKFQFRKKLTAGPLKSLILSSGVSDFFRELKLFQRSYGGTGCPEGIFKFNSFHLGGRNPVSPDPDAARGWIQRGGLGGGQHPQQMVWGGDTTPADSESIFKVSWMDSPSSGLCFVSVHEPGEYGWRSPSHILHCYFDSERRAVYGFPSRTPFCYQVGERIRVILDCDDNTLAFEKNYEFLGVAFRGLPDKQIYPSVSAVYGNTEVSMVYLGPPLDG